MTASPAIDRKTEFLQSDRPSQLPFPGRLAWKVCHALARFFGSVFFPYFRVWGETDLRPGGRIYVMRNFGLLTWLTALRVFKRPVRVVMADRSDGSRWFDIAVKCGLAPLRLDGSSDENFLLVEHLVEAGEKLLLVVPDFADESAESLVKRLRAVRFLQILFFALSGAREALPPQRYVPRVVPISAFCGMPHFQSDEDDSPLAELDFLKQALTDLDVDELPSIFFNHQRNLNRT